MGDKGGLGERGYSVTGFLSSVSIEIQERRAATQ